MGEFNRGRGGSRGRSQGGQRRDGGQGGYGGQRRDGGQGGYGGQRRDSGQGGYGGSRGRDFGDREMHKATCSECQQECEVPFKPTEGKPVYCRECYRNKRPRY